MIIGYEYYTYIGYVLLQKNSSTFYKRTGA